MNPKTAPATAAPAVSPAPPSKEAVESSIADFVKSQMTPAAPAPEVKTEPKVTEPKVAEPKAAEVKTTEPKTAGKEVIKDFKDLKLAQFIKEDEVKTTEDSKPAEGEPTAPKEGEPKSEAPKEVELTLPETASKAAKEAFAKVKSEAAAIKKKNATMESELADLKAKLAEAEPATKESESLKQEITDLKARHEAAERKIYALDVQQSETFQKLVREPLALVSSKADEMAKKYSIEPAKLKAAMAKNDTNDLDALLSEAGANNFDQVQIANLREKVIETLNLRTDLETDSKAALAAIQEESKRRATEGMTQAKKGYSQTVTATVDNLVKSVPAIFSEREGDVEWNKMVKDQLEFAKTADPTTFDTNRTALTVTMAAALPLALRQNEGLQAALQEAAEQIKLLTSRLSKHTKSEPGAGPSSTTGGHLQPASDESISDWLKRLRS